MAVLRSKTGNVEMILRPYRVSEESQPRWILTEFKVSQGGTELLSTTLSMTTRDLANLRGGLSEVTKGPRTDFVMITLDDDFIIDVRAMESKGDVGIGFWIGEPYVLMRGYRFVATASHLDSFIRGLQSDESTVAPPSRLP